MNRFIIAQHFKRLPPRSRAIIATCIYGVGAGAAAVAFQVMINVIYDSTIRELSNRSTALFIFGTLAVISTSSLAVGFLLNSFCRDAGGSGIPQLKVAFWKDFGYVSWRVVWVKFLAGVISVGGGSSLGREGPSVQLAGGVGSGLAGLLGEPKQNRRLASAASAAAGLAAAFNTPLAAVTFVLEEIIADLNSRLLGSVLLASLIGALVVHGLVGKQPAFTLAPINTSSWITYALVPFVAALASVIGIVFQECTMRLRAKRKTWKQTPGWLHPLFGGLITWAVGCSVFLVTGHMGTFSLGYDDLSAGLGNQIEWKVAGLLVAAKLLATIACYGFGGCGGIFSPTLFFGGMLGVCLSGLTGLFVPLTHTDQTTLAVVGMSACMGAVVRAPVTSILIVFEMTHEFALVPILMIGAVISQAISRKLAKENFYEALLTQDGHHLEHVIPPRDLLSWQQLPVSAIANFNPVIIRDLSPAALRDTLQAHPFERFPVLQDKQLKGMLGREEGEEALAKNRPPVLEKAVTCLPTQTIQQLQRLFIESEVLLIVVMDRQGGRIIGVISLHDLLRAQANFANAALE